MVLFNTFSLKLTICVIYLSTINDNLCGWVATISSGKLKCPIAYSILSLKFELKITSTGSVVKIKPKGKMYDLNQKNKINKITLDCFNFPCF